MAIESEDRSFGISDRALAESAREGDREAFAVLVERYYPLVVSVVQPIVRDRDDALEISQEVFLKAFQKIGELRQPERFKAWLTKIARNYALMLIRRRKHEPEVICFGDGITIHGVVRPLRSRIEPGAEDAERSDLRRKVREIIDSLAEENRKIIRLFYLDGLRLAEIAKTLGIPLGTAKWRLSQARKQLRGELMMSEVSDDYRNRSVSAPLLNVGSVHGSAGPVVELRPWEVTKTLLAQQILFSVRRELKTPGEVAKEVKADITYVQEHLAKMTEAEVLQEVQGKYRANCILFDKDDVHYFRKQLAGRGERFASVLESHDAALSEALATVSPSEQGFAEDALRWIVLPSMVLVIGLINRLEQDKGLRRMPPVRPCGGGWVFGPSLREAPLFAREEFGGFNSYSGVLSCGQVWNEKNEDCMLRPDTDAKLILRRVARGPLQTDSAVDMFSDERVFGMIESGLLRQEGEQVVANIPIFSPRDGDILDIPLSAILDDIVATVYANAPDDLYPLLDARGFSFVRSDYPCAALMLSRVGVVPALIRAGVLAALPDPLPPAWGFFAWTGTFAPLEYHG